jgi:hypothetical protein
MPKTGTAVELLLGGVWTDITSHTYLRDRITIARGRRDEGSRVDPSSCTLTLNNKGGYFSPRNPLSPLYGQIGRNTPIRVSTAAGSPFLDLPAAGPARVRASTPSTAALNVAGDLDVRFDVQPDDWYGPNVVELGGKWGAAGQRSWHAFLNSGFLEVGWSTDGTTEVLAAVSLGSTALTPRMVMRIVLDVNNGAGGKTIKFYCGPSMTGPWTQIASDQTFAGTTALFASTAALELGDVTSTASADVAAHLFAVQMRSGIDGTIVANPDFTAQAVGATSFSDSVHVPWTVTAGGIGNKRIRFVGEVSSWPARWDVSGGDVYVPVQAAGIMRRLGQGADPLQSTLRRRIPSDPNLIAYWPMEDGANSTQGYSPLPGVGPMVTSGMQFASDASLAGSSALPVLGPASSMSGVVPSNASGAWRLEFVYRIDTAPAGDFNAQFVVVQTDRAQWRIGIGASLFHIDVTAPDGTSLYSNSSTIPTDFFGSWSRFILRAQQSGGSVALQFAWVTVGGGGRAVNDSYTGTVGHVTRVAASHGSALQGMPFGHIGVFSAYDSSIFNSADVAFDGDSADGRMTRLVGEEGTPLLRPYGPTGDTLVGPQRPDTLLNLLQEAATAEVGILYEPRHAIALAARPRTSLYNQTPTLALDYSRQGDVAPPLEPTEDDQATRNDVTRSRPSGSSARATLDTGALSTLAPPLGVGRYTDSSTVNVHTDDQLPDQAAWWLHLGTWDEARYPSVTVSLTTAGRLIDQATAVDIGDRLTISNPPVWVAPGLIDLLAEGYTETIGWADWTITYNCTPAGPWSVAVSDDPVLGRADTDGSQLAASATAAATTLSVAVTAGPLWTVDPAEYPFDLRVGGEVVTARAVGAALDLVDGTFESGITGWTATGGAFATSTDARTGTGAGVLTVSGSPTQAFVRPDNTHQPAATPGVEYRYSVWVKSSANWTAMAAINWMDSGHALLSTASGTSVGLTAGVWTLLTVTATAPASTAFARPGPTLTVSPPNGTTLTIDDSVTVATSTYLTSPQSMTVLRSANGISKAQASGTDVRLAQPMIAAL